MMAEVTEAGSRDGRGAWMWCAAFFVGMFGMPIAARAIGLGGYWPMALFLLPMLLMFPMLRAFERRTKARGCGSVALSAYNRRAAGAMFVYVIALPLAVVTTREWQPVGVGAWLAALLPALPLLGLIWAMGRYLQEEQDEYLRSRAMMAGLVATGILLALATFWGFLETFGLVPHVPGWAAAPVWAIGLAIGNVAVRQRA